MRAAERRVPCARCGVPTQRANLKKHEAVCLAPYTLERLFEIGAVDTSGDGCWPWHGTTSHGYGVVTRVKVARLVLEYSGHDIRGLYSLHKCDNKACVRPDHLRVGTQRENVLEMYARGLMDREQHREATRAGRLRYIEEHPEEREIVGERMRLANTGRKLSTETRARMSEAQKLRWALYKQNEV